MASVGREDAGSKKQASEGLMGLQQVRLYGLWSQTPRSGSPLQPSDVRNAWPHSDAVMACRQCSLNLLPAAPSHPSHPSHPPSVTGLLKGDCRDSSHGRCVGGVSSLGRCDGIDRVYFAP